VGESREKREVDAMSTFVFVHGGWSGGWTWEKVVPLMKEAGHKVQAPDLPGHGDDRTSIAEVSLQSYADRISEVLDAQPEPVVLVGHSSGGQAISQAAEQRPEKVKMLVYLAAFLLRDGETVFSVGENDTESLILPNLVMSEDGSSATIREDAIREGLLHDCSEEDVKRAKSRFVPQALAPLATPITVTEGNFGRVPRVYIETLQDRAVSPSFQKEMYERLPCQKVISMNTSHSPFFSAPEELAEHIEVLARA
jgi:pimeloyl-ACP methyl ester carboxylesterase